MAAQGLTTGDQELLTAIVESYEADAAGVVRLKDNLQRLLSEVPLVHSIRARTRDVDSLRGKLVRKLSKCKDDGVPFDIGPENLRQKVNDLVGVRLLHLNTSQFPDIDAAIRSLLTEQNYAIIEGPVARVWDNEYKEIFAAMGIATQANERMYTSVHYVVEESARSKRTAEIQVRTLAEELWGEVDHSMNYPKACAIGACREQIKVLARSTSACTRLVDSIYYTKAQAEAESVESD